MSRTRDNSGHERYHQKKREMTGLLYMTLSALGFSTMSLLVKLSGSNFPSFEMVFARSVVQAFFGLLGCLLLKKHPLGEPGVRGWLFVRGLAGTIGLSLFFYSITQLPLADATGKKIYISIDLSMVVSQLVFFFC